MLKIRVGRFYFPVLWEVERMNLEQKQKVSQMRHRGMSYQQIAADLGVSENTIKSYCQRNNLGAVKGSRSEIHTECKQCGRPLLQGRKGHPSKFCSDECRRKWWKDNEGQLTRKAWYTISCTGCGKTFESYGNKGRKFCSHSCYINSRFNGTGDSKKAGDGS